MSAFPWAPNFNRANWAGRELFVPPPCEVQVSMSKGIAALENEGFER